MKRDEAHELELRLISRLSLDTAKSRFVEKLKEGVIRPQANAYHLSSDVDIEQAWNHRYSPLAWAGLCTNLHYISLSDAIPLKDEPSFLLIHEEGFADLGGVRQAAVKVGDEAIYIRVGKGERNRCLPWFLRTRREWYPFERKHDSFYHFVLSLLSEEDMFFTDEDPTEAEVREYFDRPP